MQISLKCFPFYSAFLLGEKMFLVKFFIISTSITHFNGYLVKSDTGKDYNTSLENTRVSDSCICVIWTFFFLRITDSAVTYNGRNTTDCEPPEFIENGMLEVRNSYSDVTFGNGTFIKYSCAVGYKLEPTDSKTRCCINGTWTNTNPYCGMYTYPRFLFLFRKFTFW